MTSGEWIVDRQSRRVVGIDIFTDGQQWNVTELPWNDVASVVIKANLQRLRPLIETRLNRRSFGRIAVGGRSIIKTIVHDQHGGIKRLEPCVGVRRIDLRELGHVSRHLACSPDDHLIITIGV